MRQFLSQVGYSMSNVWFIPCSGINGTNLVARGQVHGLRWYSGPTLLECLGMSVENECLSQESIDIPLRSLDLPLRVSISDISRGSRANVVNVTGHVDSGVIQVGDEIASEPGGNSGSVRSESVFVENLLMVQRCRLRESPHSMLPVTP